ncbi:MAG: ATP-binding protein [Myxococcales bacterium]|nr:ATP-binding protein [Myxococcales bacterium]
MDAAASFRLTIDKPSLLRYAAVQSVIELCRAARIVHQSPRDTADPHVGRAKRISYPVHPAQAVDLTHKFDQDFVSAFLEVLNNIVLHAYRRAEAPIDVVGKFYADEVRVEISHFGLRFDIDAIPAPDLESLPEGGMGLFIARSLLDELHYYPSHDAAEFVVDTAPNATPHRWSLSKKLTEPNAQEISS